MSRRPKPLTFEDVLMKYTAHAARYLARRYFMLKLEVEDVAQDLRVWVLSEGKERVERWLASDPQQTTRCYRELLDQGIRAYEKEKAQQAGYEVFDVYWYSAPIVAAAMRDVINPDWIEPYGRIGDRTALILDIRRVMTTELYEYFDNAEEDDPNWDSNIAKVVALLGGSFRPHQRRAISNAKAQFITVEQGG